MIEQSLIRRVELTDRQIYHVFVAGLLLIGAIMDIVSTSWAVDAFGSGVEYNLLARGLIGSYGFISLVMVKLLAVILTIYALTQCHKDDWGKKWIPRVALAGGLFWAFLGISNAYQLWTVGVI